jgi:hypothetical protein
MNNFDGYYESESTTNARAWRIALESVGYFPNLNTEAEACALANLVDVAKAAARYKTCPSCTWRMDIELQDGICPQCGVNWFALIEREMDAWENPASELDDTAMFSEYYGDSESVREAFGGWNVTATAEWRRRHLNEE